MVQSSRNVLINYCSTISEKHFIGENAAFGRGSIRNLLVHIGNTYEYWLARQAMKEVIVIRSYQQVANIREVSDYFAEIDLLMARFLAAHSETFVDEMVLKPDSGQVRASALQLFTHVITHEFHHKGQILSLSRHLGYIPVDTDIVR